MYYFTLFAVAYLFVVFQYGILSYFTDGRLVPEISLVIIVFLGFHLDTIRGCILSVIIGFLVDCLLGTLTGFNMFIYTFVFFLSRLIAPHVYVEKREAIIVVTLLCAFGKMVLEVFLGKWVYNLEISGELIGLYLVQLIIVSYLAPLVFELLRYSQQKHRA
ncbi:MAG: rod shape-determining protein MreD [Syntrophales bacterium]|nr:rod shape-determining protein MreD [Syntrophales bacterium]